MRSCIIVLLLLGASVRAAEIPREVVRVESTLATATTQIRQFAFDKDPATYYASKSNATKQDFFTLVFEKPITIQSIIVLSGTPKGEQQLSAGEIAVSTDGKKFESIGQFKDGKAEAKGSDARVLAVRIRPTEDLKHPLVIREITIDSNPRLQTFRYPVEIALDVSDAPEMKAWGEKVVQVCEREYPKICDLLASDGFKPLTQIRMELKSDYKGVAQAAGNRITGSVNYFKDRPADIGAMVHETAHCVQSYRARNLPGWLVEGVADYVRFWHYEPGKAGRVPLERAKYDGSYRTTATFLAFASDKYDAKLVTKLNALLRQGKYDATAWKTITGKTVEELNQEWRTSLAK